MTYEKEDWEIRKEQKEREKEEALQERRAMLDEIPSYVKCHKCPIWNLCPHEQSSASGLIQHMLTSTSYWYVTFKSQNVSLREELDLMKKATENCSLLSRRKKQEKDQRRE